MIEFSNLSVKRTIKLNPEELKSFEAGIAKEYEAGKIKGPIHLSDGNEEILIDIFPRISNQDFYFLSSVIIITPYYTVLIKIS